MKVYKTKSFRRQAKGNLTDKGCREAISKVEKGLIDADLGGHLIKQRIHREKLEAATESRVLVIYKRGEVAVFLHVFPKSSKANLTNSELPSYLEFAEFLDKTSDADFQKLCSEKGWRELKL